MKLILNLLLKKFCLALLLQSNEEIESYVSGKKWGIN